MKFIYTFFLFSGKSTRKRHLFMTCNVKVRFKYLSCVLKRKRKILRMKILLFLMENQKRHGEHKILPINGDDIKTIHHISG